MAYDVYDIAAYQIQASEIGIGKIVSSSLTSPNETGSTTGLKVCVYVNDVYKKSVVIARGSTGNFDCDLGSLSADDKVYVAIGANGDQWNNLGHGLNYSIQITPIPEPATDMLLLGSAI